MSIVQVLMLSSAVSMTVGAIGLLVAARERSRGSGWWVVPEFFGALLIVLSIVRLVGASA